MDRSRDGRSRAILVVRGRLIYFAMFTPLFRVVDGLVISVTSHPRSWIKLPGRRPIIWLQAPVSDPTPRATKMDRKRSLVA